MNSTRFFALYAAFAMTCSSAPLNADDWKTTDGKVYQDVHLVRHDPDAVTILYTDGGAQIPLAKLSPDLQKRFGYDPAAAKIAAAARAKEEIANGRALQAEMDLTSAQHQAGPEPAVPAAIPTDSSANTISFMQAPLYSMGSHHSMDDSLKSSSSLKSPADSSHHTMDEMAQSTTAMRRDLSDPTYHTMAHLVYIVNTQGLGSDPSDPNHRTVGQAAAGNQ